MKTRMEKQFEFIIEIDKMKNIFRQTLIADKSRRENDAEHSWHLAIMAMLLYEYADPVKVDLYRVLKMTLVHDLVEVYAGDTFAYDAKGNETKAERERAAADKLFGLLPDDQNKEIRSLWEEFDSMETPDSKYAAAIDRLQPFIANYVTEGHTWKLGNVSKEMVNQRMHMVKEGAPDLWPYVAELIELSIKKGYLQE